MPRILYNHTKKLTRLQKFKEPTLRRYVNNDRQCSLKWVNDIQVERLDLLGNGRWVVGKLIAA
jgi:hypothetical protein